MSYTPVELRHVRVNRSLFGYNRATVEQVIEEVAESFEHTWRERGELADQVHELEQQIIALRGREELLTNTLVAAEQAASDVRANAKREAALILAEAHSESRAVTRTAQNERERLFAETRRIEALLRAALSVIEDGPSVLPAAAEVPFAADSWPNEQTGEGLHEDTRAFNAVELPPVVDLVEQRQAAEAPERTLRRVVGGESRDFDWGD
jgi:cell division initiation protein